MTVHLTDDVLVRRLDGELDRLEDYRVGTHLSACDRCRAGIEEIAALSGRFSAALPLVDPPAASLASSSRWIDSPLWRAAAAIALLAGLALAITPVRAWIAERLGLAGDTWTGAPAGAPADAPPPAAPAGADLRIAFMPSSDRFVVRVSGRQRAGTLILAAAPGDTASAEISGPAGVPADLLVLPDGLAIHNEPFSTADYRVVVPAGLSRIEVHVGEHLAWSGSPGALTGRVPATIDLSRNP